MDTRRRPEQERTFSVRLVTSPEEITRYFAFADPMLHIDNHDVLGSEYSPEEIAKAIEKGDRILFVLEDAKGDFVAGAMGVMTTEFRQRCLNIDAQHTVLLLEYAAVREDKQGEGYISILDNARMEWGKKLGADVVATEATRDNFHSMLTKLHAGFCIHSIEKLPGEPEYYVLSRPISKADREPEGQVKELPAIDKDVIEQHLQEGWVGVDIKNKGDVTSEDPNDWVLILAKDND